MKPSLPIGAKLPINSRISVLRDDSSIREDAMKIASSPNVDDQHLTLEDKFERALQGLAVERAVLYHLVDIGYQVKRAPRGSFHYDGSVMVDGIEVRIDIKCRYAGKHWQQTKHEAQTVPASGVPVLYLCIDYMPKQDEYIHKGQCWSVDLRESHFGCPYATSSQLEQVI